MPLGREVHSRVVKRVLLCVSLFACSSRSSGAAPDQKDNDVARVRADPCATPGATYLVTLTQLPGGTCGPIANQTVTVGYDGTVPAPGPCGSSTFTGCEEVQHDCYALAMGLTCVMQDDITFVSDGSAASGSETVSCQEGHESCASTYAVEEVEQAAPGDL